MKQSLALTLTLTFATSLTLQIVYADGLIPTKSQVAMAISLSHTPASIQAVVSTNPTLNRRSSPGFDSTHAINHTAKGPLITDNPVKVASALLNLQTQTEWTLP